MSPPCPNCGADNVADFCACCGQRADVSLRPLSEWLAELYGSIVDLDIRGLRTLGTLLTKPGEATRRYAQGQRASQAPPLRLFLVVSAIVIAIMGVAGFFERPEVTGIEDPVVRERLELLFPLLNFLAPLIFVPWLKLLFPRRLAQLHFVMALHFCTFIVVATSPIILLLLWPQYLPYGQLVGMLVSMTYLVLAIRRCFETGWPRAIFSGVVATLGYYATLGALQWAVMVRLGGSAAA